MSLMPDVIFAATLRRRFDAAAMSCRSSHYARSSSPLAAAFCSIVIAACS